MGWYSRRWPISAASRSWSLDRHLVASEAGRLHTPHQIARRGREAFMGITGDRHVGTYEGHTVELIRNNWFKTLKLLIDGKKVASTSVILPYDVTLNGTFEHE